MRGLTQGSMGDHVAGIEFLRRAVDVLEWGLREWKDVPRSECGVVFELSFIRGVRRYCLEELMKVGTHLHSCTCSIANFLKLKGYSVKGDEIGHSIEEIAEIARQMIVETDSNPPFGVVDPGFYGSFWLYPKADALS
jgi:hypothetical protein